MVFMFIIKFLIVWCNVVGKTVLLKLEYEIYYISENSPYAGGPLVDAEDHVKSEMVYTVGCEKEKEECDQDYNVQLLMDKTES